MSKIVEPAPVLRVCSCLTGLPELLPEVESALEHEFGAVELRSEPFAFDISDYYRDEMGDGLRRTWLCFRRLCAAERLPEARMATERIEARFAVEGRRRVNLDPGYLDLGKLVLASLKEAPDKIYELTLYTKTEDLWNLTTQRGANQRQEFNNMWVFAEAVPEGGVRATRLKITYKPQHSIAEYLYDPESNTYKRFDVGEPSMDALTNEQIAPANVMVLYVNHVDTDILADAHDPNQP